MKCKNLSKILRSATKEVEMTYSTVDAFYIQTDAGVTQHLSELAKNGINISFYVLKNRSIIQDMYKSLQPLKQGQEQK